MGMYNHIKETFKKEYKERDEVYRQRLSKWKKEGTMERVERPTNLSRARTLGYKAKQGYAIIRVKIARGQRKRPAPSGGRKPGKNIRYLSGAKSLQHICEQRVARRYRNMEVLNSYWVGEDGQRKYFEVIMVDPNLVKIDLRQSRAFRGLTSASRKSNKKLNKKKG
jgi:large subunit ribosomal protein L15e